ncbi:MAG: hypothetical protein ACSLEX_04250, partial [Minisyncoccota bacterium]
IANINLSDIHVVSPHDTQLSVTFTLTNQGSVMQTDIRYGFEFLKEQDGVQVVTDTYVPEETLSLAPGQKLQKTATVPIAPTLSGDTTLWVYAKTTGGLTLGLGTAGTINPKTALAGIEILSHSCVLSIEGDPQTYTLYQGVDISQDETLSLSCEMRNTTNQELAVAPVTRTFRRSIYGSEVSPVEPLKSILTFAPQESKRVMIPFPKMSLPQAYDTTLVLKDAQGTPVSSSIVSHFVLRGSSATIQNLILDKSMYQKGDRVIAKLFWSPSADGFDNARGGAGTTIDTPQVTLKVTDENGTLCAQGTPTPLDTQQWHMILNAVTTQACSGPQATVSITDKNGTVLDERTVIVPAEHIPSMPETMIQKSLRPIALLITFVLFLTALYFIIKSRRIRMTLGLFLLVLGAGMTLGGGTAEALTLSITSGGGNSYGSVTINTDKSQYAIGDKITLNYSGSATVCSNVDDAVEFDLRASFGNSQFVTLASGATRGGALSGSKQAFDVKGTYPTEVGVSLCTENAATGADRRCDYGTISLDIGYKDDGVCGSADGTSAQSKSSLSSYGALCADGTASSVSGSYQGPWSWQCIGAYGGSTSSCNMYVACDVPWGGTIDHQASVKAYKTASVPAGSTCLSENRRCNNGALSGSYTNQSCTVDSAVTPPPVSFSCTGTLPANASSYTNDMTGLSANTPYTYTATNTTAKCEFACNAGYTWNGSACTPPPASPAPTVDLQINNSNGPLNLNAGDTKNITWTSTNATACSGSSSDGFGFPSDTTKTSGSQSVQATTTSNHTVSCTGPGGNTSDSVQVNLTCSASTGTYGTCNCTTNTKSRTNINTSCLPWTESTACNASEINNCRDFSWREVAP